MHSARTLRNIYQEHHRSVPFMVETLMNLDVPAEDALLLSRMPWELSANRIAVERERLGLPPVHPFPHWKLPPAPSAWLTPTVIVKMFELVLDGPGKPPGVTEDEEENGDCTGGTLVLPA